MTGVRAQQDTVFTVINWITEKVNICKTNSAIWKENFEDDCENIKICKNKTVFAVITTKKSAVQYNN